MVDITHKNNTLRAATAQAVVKVGSAETIAAIQENRVPKGDVFAMSRAAGLLGVKKTPELLPDCHPMPIEYTDIFYEIDGLLIRILVTVKTIYKTGVEVEAMHGASVVALNIYDMLKPLDKEIEIEGIRLLEKKGGKSSFPNMEVGELSAAVVVCSDSVSNGEAEDRSGKAIQHKLEDLGIANVSIEVIPDELEEIREKAQYWSGKQVGLLIFTGGTGFSERDVTPEALLPLLDKQAKGIEEAIRAYGQNRMPFAMLSRSVAGTIKNTLVLALPGSVGGVKESMDAIFPGVLHIFKVLQGKRHGEI